MHNETPPSKSNRIDLFQLSHFSLIITSGDLYYPNNLEEILAENTFTRSDLTFDSCVKVKCQNAFYLPYYYSSVTGGECKNL